MIFILWTLCEIYLKSLHYKFTKCEEEMWKDKVMKIYYEGTNYCFEVFKSYKLF